MLSREPSHLALAHECSRMLHARLASAAWRWGQIPTCGWTTLRHRNSARARRTSRVVPSRGFA